VVMRSHEHDDESGGDVIELDLVTDDWSQPNRAPSSNSSSPSATTPADTPAELGPAGDAPRAAPRSVEADLDHWRERAVLWRERALAAELVSRMLQRNLDDLRANLDDLRASTSHPLPISASRMLDPWRRSLHDFYLKCVGRTSQRGSADDTKSVESR
jgi:hypothetical protein